MTDWTAVSAFMATVVPWPGSPNEPGHVGLWYSMPNGKFDPTRKSGPDNKKQFISGWPYRDPDQFVSRAGWVNTVPDKFKDVWFCTSLQKRQGKTKQGKPKAQKGAAEALTMKAIWIDIDVDPNDPKKYATKDEGWTAFVAMRKALNIPPPSAVVDTGGGLHVYWISDKPLLPHEWSPYANGLKQLLLSNNFKFDPTCTADAARILRVPGTFNHKYDPPKPVELLPLPLKLYDFTQLDFLKQYAGVAPAKTAQAHQLFADEAQMDSFKAGPAFKIEGEPGLEAGIDKFGDSLLDPRPIFAKDGCGFYRDALKHGGKNNDQPQWNLAVLGTTFMEEGNALAHEISKLHPTYTEADTQALFDRKLAERTDRGIGYPSCAAIAGAGSEACKTCPLFKAGKSPLNIRPTVTATVNGTTIPDDWFVPDGFALNDKGIICKLLEQRDDDDNVETFEIPIFQCEFMKPWLEKGGNMNEALNFTVSVDKGHTEQVAVALGEISTQGFASYLGKRRVLIDPKGEKFLKEFFLSTIGKLRALASAHTAVPFGWYEENGVRRGFVFGGKVMLDDGTERPCGTTDPNIARMYLPVGTMKDWMDAARTVTDRKRPELNAILLTSFLSPLLDLVGRSTVVFSSVSYGSDSGAGKSSAYAVGMSVWGHPVMTKGTKTQTANNVTTIMKTIRHLPFYWDEITNATEQQKVLSVIHEVDGQKEKGRNKDGMLTQAVGMFQLAIHYAANLSLVSFIRQNDTSHDAALNRVLEWEVKKVMSGPGHLPDADATLRVNQTLRNYGHMGLKYAKFLALNHKQIMEECRDKINEVQTLTKGSNSERYWMAGVGLMIQAAKYAQQMGLDIDPAEIEKFMYKVYLKNQDMRDASSAGNTVDNAEDVLTRYLKDRDAGDHGIWTNYMHNQKGKPQKPVIILKNPTMQRNFQGGIEFRFAVENRQLIIAKKDFDAYLLEKKHAENQVYAGIKVVYNSFVQRLGICSGLVTNSGREPCLVLNISPNTPLWDYMTTFTPPEEKAKMEKEEPVSDIKITTGLEVSAA